MSKLIYIARPIVGITEKQKKQIDKIERKCYSMTQGKDVLYYNPAELMIPNAWNIREEAWAQAVFTMDLYQLDHAHAMILLDFGRGVGGGAYWEMGYAFDNIPITVIRMPDVTDASLMVKCGATQFFTYNAFMSMNNVDFFAEDINKGKACVLN